MGRCSTRARIRGDRGRESPEQGRRSSAFTRVYVPTGDALRRHASRDALEVACVAPPNPLEAVRAYDVAGGYLLPGVQGCARQSA